MFYQGDLQSGISKAVQEAKLVACFVTDDGDESKQWENDFLQDPTLKDSLQEQAILLRLVAKSTEANYLAAIFPLPKTPTFVVIRNGELKQYIAAGVSKDEFLSRLKAVLVSSNPQEAPPAQTAPLASTSQPPQAVTVQDTTTASSSNSATSSNNPSNTTVQAHLAERSARLEAQRKEQEAKDKAKRAAEAEARKKKLEEAATPSSTSSTTPPASADMKYALMQKKRQQEARAERARILKRVEEDKMARRARAAEEKAQHQTGTEPQSSESGPQSVKVPSKKASAECALQIRLFDGSTIRSRFPSQATLSKDVRSWIDEKQIGDQPYTFKQVLTPLPNKNIETSEEVHSLESLDLTPSATLILLPVTGYSSAYSGAGGLVSTGVSIVSSGIGIAGRVFGGIFGSAAPAATAAGDSQDAAPPTAVPSTGINVRTLRDQRRDDQQFYNGNALNFEPRRDEDDKKDD